MTEHITPIMGEPADMLTAAELVEELAGFEVSAANGQILMDHGRNCPWRYAFSERFKSNPLMLVKVVETAILHNANHHADGVYCVNAQCRTHFGGDLDIHGDS